MEGDQQYEREKPPKQTRHRQIISFTGAAGLLAVATVNLAIFVFFSRRRTQKKKDLPGSNVRMNLSADEIRKLADRIIAESKRVHDALASVPVDKVTHQNIMSLADLEARHFPLVQSCVFSKFVSVSEDVRKASIEAGKRINEHRSMCGKREDVYRVVKAFAGRGQCQNAEAKSYVQSLVTEFERNGLHLTLAKREEVQRLRAQIDELSIQFVQNLNSDCTFLLFSETQLDGLPSEFLQVGAPLPTGVRPRTSYPPRPCRGGILYEAMGCVVAYPGSAFISFHASILSTNQHSSINFGETKNISGVSILLPALVFCWQ